MHKILFYIDSMQYGGANRVMANLVDYFFGLKYDVVLVNDMRSNDRIPEYEIPAEVGRYFLDSKRKNRFLKNFVRIKRLRKIIKQESPDIVLSFMGPPNMRMLMATLGLPVKKITSVRNDPNVECGTGIRKLIFRLMMNLADGVVFQTQDAANYFTKRVRRKSTIIFNPVSDRFYQHPWERGGTEIVVVGRLQPQKNPMNVLCAFEKISDEIPAYTLNFYGDGELRTEMEEYVTQHGLQGRVFLHGRTDHVECILQKAALYVLCSDYEGMPNALMEAMAVGVPVISTDCPCGGPRALIENETQGILVPCGNAQLIANALLILLSNPKCQDNMSIHERERAKCFYPSDICSEWKKFITDVCFGRKTS